MFKSVVLASSLLALALVPQEAGAAASTNCTGSSCTASMDDTASGWVSFFQGTTYTSVIVYYGNYARSCYIYPSDANYARISQIFIAATAAKANGTRAEFTVSFNAQSTCTSASLRSYR